MLYISLDNIIVVGCKVMAKWNIGKVFLRRFLTYNSVFLFLLFLYRF